MTGFGLAPFGLSPFGGPLDEDLSDWEFELDGFTLGRRRAAFVTKLDRGGSEGRTQDVPAVAADARLFGRDRKTPGTWAFEIATNARDLAGALETLDALEAVWDADAIRATPGGVVPLRYRLAGRTRRVYGRPRRFAASPTVTANQGLIPVVADFALAEAGSYDDTEQTVAVGIAPADLSGRGVAFPVTFPLLWGGAAGQPRSRSFRVGGTRRTPLTLTVVGPVVDPYVIVDGAVFQLRGRVLAGPHNALTISAAPWDMGVFTAGGSPAPLELDAKARLESLRVTPGQHLITLGGIDPTGTATAAVTWRDAYVSI